MFLLDLSAAFDTVDHSILLSRLALRFGVNGQVIAWIESYLKDREHFVQIENTKPSIRQLQLNWRTTGFRKGGHSFMFCIQHQLLISPSLMISIITYIQMIHKFVFFPSQSQQDLCLVKSKLEACVKHIDSWIVFS